MGKRITGVRRLFMGDSPVTGNPTNDAANWTDLGRVEDGFDAEPTTGQTTDGMGAPIATDARVNRTYRLIDMDSLTPIQTAENAGTKQDVAELLPNGDYRIYRGCKVEVDYDPNPGRDSLQRLWFRVETAADTWDTIRDIVTPT